MDSKGISDIFFYVSDDKVYAFNVKTASEGVIIDGTKEHYAIDGVDCTEVAAPTTENPNATMIQLTIAIKDGNIPRPLLGQLVVGFIVIAQMNQMYPRWRFDRALLCGFECGVQ